jgi:hypothetical protein
MLIAIHTIRKRGENKMTAYEIPEDTPTLNQTLAIIALIENLKAERENSK